MTKLLSETRNLNIRYDLPAEIWDRVPDGYALMEGWLGFGDGIKGMEAYRTGLDLMKKKRTFQLQ